MLFGWFSKSPAEPGSPIVDQDTVNLLHAMETGADKSGPTMRTILRQCGCNPNKWIYPHRDVEIKLQNGAQICISGFAAHLFAYHRSKVDQEEWAMVKNLPKVGFPEKEEEMKLVLESLDPFWGSPRLWPSN